MGLSAFLGRLGEKAVCSWAREEDVAAAWITVLAPSSRCFAGGSAGVVLGLALLGLMAAPLRASSPAAWKAYDHEVRSACLKASQLAQTRVLGERIDVPVADGTPTGSTLVISALLLEGTYPQAHMGGRKGRELCLFEQRTRRATVAEAESFDSARPNPSLPQP